MLINRAAGFNHYTDANSLVVFNPATRLYYYLDEIAAFVWGLMRKPMTIGEICAAVQSTFDVESEACQRDVAALLEELEHIGLIETAAE